jgi:hypothetical protein
MGGSVDGKEGTKNHPPIFCLMTLFLYSNIDANLKTPYFSTRFVKIGSDEWFLIVRLTHDI